MASIKLYFCIVLEFVTYIVSGNSWGEEGFFPPLIYSIDFAIVFERYNRYSFTIQSSPVMG